MAKKNRTRLKQPDKVRTKWVGRAKMFCRTTIKDNVQSQEWLSK